MALATSETNQEGEINAIFLSTAKLGVVFCLSFYLKNTWVLF